MLPVTFLLHLANNLGSAHATPEEFDNGGFTLKTHQTFVFCINYAREIWKRN